MRGGFGVRGESLVQEEEEKVRFGVCPVRDAIPLWEAPLAALARWFRCPQLMLQSKQSINLRGRFIQFASARHHDFLISLISNIAAVLSATSRQFDHDSGLRRQRFSPPLQSPPNNTSTSHRIQKKTMNMRP